MNGSKLFVSSCDRRELARRRQGHHSGRLMLGSTRQLGFAARANHVLLTLLFLAAGGGAFIVGRFGL